MSVAASYSMQVFERSRAFESVLLAALEKFEYQALYMYNRLLLAALEEPEDSCTTQKKDVKKTPAKMLPCHQF